MNLRRVGCAAIFVVVGVLAFWVLERRPSFSQLVGYLVRPITGSRSAVRSAEQKRVTSDASSDIERPLRPIQIGMTEKDVRRLLGEPVKAEVLRRAEPLRERWLYPRIRRILVFEDGRLVSIVIS